MINKRVTLLISIVFLATSLLGVMPAKAINSANENTIKSVVDKDGTGKKLTVMVYSDGDNNLEGSLLGDIQQMKEGYVNNPNLNLIVLVDRTPGYSADKSVLGQNFTDTRMYKIESNKAIRISGGDQFPEITKTSRYEANMGDGNTLKKFINSCKANYPADKYALVISNHGGGARDKNEGKKVKNPKAVCWDDTNGGDCLYTAEVTDKLTNRESVDVLAYDACLMGTAEVAYQYRPGNGGFQANIMVASAPVVWGDGYDYKEIFSRLRAGGGNNGQVDSTVGGKELYYDPSEVTDTELGEIMVEAQRDSVNAAGDTSQVLSCFDLNKIENVKSSVDKLSRALWSEKDKAFIEKLRGTGSETSLLHYFDTRSSEEWLDYPYFDLYDLCKRISTSSGFSANVKALAKGVMTNVDDLIVYSYGGSDFSGFTEGKSGLSIFLPDGGKIYRDNYSGTSYTGWQAQRWYNSVDTSKYQSDFLYGKLSWCKDGQTPKINDVGNWFELLDSWFDSSNGSDGGVNWYQW
ncbi:clostripain [Clostridium sp. HBUAS56017]|uniref:clostripain n=1 Tax=Clostridium sp. HBUAS56017 TaxID=2571128 RepID=UPI00117766FF|nr:clostripain [Clostridium sp. HBUAS56017]